MADEFDTVWEAKNHTLAKHAIFQSYLKAWVPIVGNQVSKRNQDVKALRVVDAFAGPGIYAAGELGSPILALETILKHSAPLPVPVRLTFIEQDKDRFDSLQGQVSKYQQEIETSNAIDSAKCHNGDCIEFIDKSIDRVDNDRQKLGPAFFFLDQFGYSQVPMSLLAKIMKHDMCECLLFLNWSKFGRFLSDQTKWPTFTKAFGGEEWKDALTAAPGEAARVMQALFKHSLQEKAGVKYVWHFAMCDDRSQLTHWLFFCTNHIRGLEEMKKAMRRTDASGAFSFSDQQDPGQFQLIKYYDSAALSKDIRERFSGKQASIHEIKHFVLTETPEVNFKRELGAMEGTDFRVVKAPPGRSKGFANEDMILEFY